MQIGFYGAAQTVTGSKHIIQTKSGKRYLLDCGFYQGRGRESFMRNKHFPFSAKSIDCVFLSHAHIDHSGNLPLLVKEGYAGKIYCSSATYDLCRIMLLDSAYIQESDADFFNRHKKEGEAEHKPIYTKEDVEVCLGHFEVLPMNEWQEIDEECQIKLTDAGHILGASVLNFKIQENGSIKKICYTGDIGRFINKILKTPQPFPTPDVIICESTYGDRLHSSIKEAKIELMNIVQQVCLEQRGKLIIPAFSVGKTQELIFTLNKLHHEDKLPKIKVYVDSPLAINATEIMRSHPECFSDATLRFMQTDPDPFGFSGLEYVQDVELSKQINTSNEACIVISASGMAEAGRVQHHLRHGLGHKQNGILLIGYAEAGSLAGQLREGNKVVQIFGEHLKVKASVHSIDFFSAHADYNEIIRFLSYIDPRKVEHLFLVHGNKMSMEALKERLYHKGFYNIDIPEYKEIFYV